MLPILFEHDATSWDTFGIGVLSDAISCEVEESRNGPYELEMQYPVTGAFFSEIALRRLILAKPNYTDNPQPFRIYSISKPLNGIVTVNAQHISYDLSGYVDAPFAVVGINAALDKILNSDTITPSTCPFRFTTNITSSSKMELKHPESVRALMGGVRGSLLDTYGGEWHFDGYGCDLRAARGMNRGVTIKYGVNLTDLRQEENNEAVYTAVYPYYYNSDTEVLVSLPEKTVQVSGAFPYARVLPLDLTYNFEETPTEAQLRAKANSYIVQNGVGIPKINITIEFVELDGISGRVDLCDTVTVQFDALGVSATTECIRTKWDVLTGRYIEAELGSAKNSFADTIVETSEFEEAIQERTSQFQTVATGIASKVTGNTGGFIVLHDTDSDGEPDEILIMDSDDIATAVKIIRMNNAGIAFSKSGYAGPYETAWNIDGEFVADFIASGELHTDRVTIFGDSQFSWDDACIEMIDPSNTNRVIRLGKYDGTNYGLGFSVDGGTTWVSGFGFDGIKVIRDTSDGGYAAINGVRFKIDNSSGVTIAYIGEESNLVDLNGNYVTAPHYMLGTRLSGSETGIYSFAAGRMSSPGGAYCCCIGYRSKASANYSIGIGYQSEATRLYAIAIGYQNISDGLNSISLGVSNNANDYGIAIGESNTLGSDHSIAIGSGNSASYMGVVLGAQNTGNSNSIVIGNRSLAQGTLLGGAIAIGIDVEAERVFSVGIGFECEATGDSSTSIGNGSIASGDWSFAAAGGEANGDGSIAIGSDTVANNNYGVAIGRGAETGRTNSFVCGSFNAIGSWIFVVGNGTDSARSNALRLANSGNMWIAGTLTQASDERLKTISGDVPDLSSIRAVKFKWNDLQPNHDDLDHIGYIAQDVEKVAPYLVETDESSGYKSVDYVALLCAKVEMLERTVERLVNRVAELEGAKA